MSGQQRQFNAPQRVKNIFDNNNLALKAPCPTPSGQGQISTLRWIFTNGNPRLVIWTNDPADKDNTYGKIEVRMTPIVLLDIVEALRTAANGPDDVSYTAAVENFVGNPARKENTHSITVGKGKDGVVFIVVRDLLNRTRPVIPFTFNGSPTHNWVQRGGEPADPRLVSPVSARAWANLLEGPGMKLCTETWKEPERRNQQGGNRQGGGNWNNNRQGGGGGNWNNNQGGGNGGGNGGNWNNNQGGGGQQATNVGIDDDIPF